MSAPAFTDVPTAIDEIRAGRMMVIVDDEDREAVERGVHVVERACRVVADPAAASMGERRHEGAARCDDETATHHGVGVKSTRVD